MPTAKAFATSANLGPGFDVCGLCLSQPFDLVSVEESSSFSIKNNGKHHSLDTDAAPVAKILSALQKDFGVSNKVTVTVTKGIKPKAGMGASAAESVGFLLAVDDLFEMNLTKEQLVEYAAIGEQAVAGAKHYDNISPCAYGGFTVTTTNPLEIRKITPPEDLAALLLISSAEKASTAFARSVLPSQVPLPTYVKATANIVKLVSSLDSKNTKAFLDSILLDEVIEPARAKAGILPLLAELRQAAEKKEIGVCSSGAGPTIIAFLEKNNPNVQEFKQTANRLFQEKGLSLEIVDALPNNTGSLLI